MSRRTLGLAVLLALALIVGVIAPRWSRGAPDPLASFAAQVGAEGRADPPPRATVSINRPAGPPRIVTGIVGPDGQPVSLTCSSCHAMRRPRLTAHRGEDLQEFHSGLQFSHGDLACYACHDPSDTDALRLADQRRVEYVDVMTLCSQCHGSQRIDYDHGAHGGMNGYWDLTRGPRDRNNCVDCHDPHAPAFPQMRPTFKPIDRFLDPPAHPDPPDPPVPSDAGDPTRHG